MGIRFTKLFDGAVTLADTERACTDEVLDGQPKRLIRVEGVIHNKDGGGTENLNEALFETVDDPLSIIDLFNDFLFVDVSTAEGASDAAAASNGRTNIGGDGAEFNIWVENKMVPIQILGRHVAGVGSNA